MTVKWFCRLCWRTDSMEFGDCDIAQARKEHARMVELDVAAVRRINGTEKYPDEIMVKFPAEFCDGDIQIGETRSKGKFKKGPGSLDLDGGDPLKF